VNIKSHDHSLGTLRAMLIIRKLYLLPTAYAYGNTIGSILGSYQLLVVSANA
jgi:hypothetical protein